MYTKQDPKKFNLHITLNTCQVQSPMNNHYAVNNLVRLQMVRSISSEYSHVSPNP